MLILALAFVAKRMQRGTAPQGQQLAVVDTLHLGTKERLLLVQAGQQKVLLGVTATQITHLVEVDAVQQLTDKNELQTPAVIDSSFAEKAS